MTTWSVHTVAEPLTKQFFSADQRNFPSMKGPPSLQGWWLSFFERDHPPVNGALPSDKEGLPFVGHRITCRSEAALRWSEGPSGPLSVRGGPPSSRGGPLSVRLAVRRSKNIFLVRVSFNTRGPSVGYRTNCRSEGAFRLSLGPLTARLALHRSKIFSWSEGHSVV